MTAHPDRDGAGLRDVRLQYAARHAAQLSLIRARREREALEREIAASADRQRRAEVGILAVGSLVVLALLAAVALVALGVDLG
jgi:hypothetical protein